MIAVKGYRGKQVAVLGLGRSGLASLKALKAGGADTLAWDDNEEARANAENLGFTVADLTKTKNVENVACLVVSPGIPHLYPKPHQAISLAWDLGTKVDNDIGLFFQSFAGADWDKFDQFPKVVAVTGSNGKSTTSALIHHILSEVGRPCQLGGNIGRGVLDLEPAIDGEVVVLELSSYQTELARSLTPDLAVLTNISPDHLDRHGGHGGYFAAKRRLFAEGGPDRGILGVDDDEGRYLAGQLSSGPTDDRVIRVSSAQKLSGPGWNIFARKGFLSEYRKSKQIASIDLRNMSGLPGAHNHQNACAAYAVCRSLGLSPRVIEMSLASFAGLAHRSQVIGEKDGAVFVNDSKATNVSSAAVALQAFSNIRWICGGLAKEGGLSELASHMERVKKAYVIGRDAKAFALELPKVDQMICNDMEAAVAAAAKDAEPGDTILLAPAAASFDQYDNFEQRGDDFVSEASKYLKN